MADKKKYNMTVYKTDSGTKYHYYLDCRYIKDKATIKTNKNDARKDKLTLCSDCRKNANNNINPAINNNYNLNHIQNNNNNNVEHQNFGFKKFKSENIAFNNIHNKVLSNIIEEEEDKQTENSKCTISTINFEFSDFLNISNSFAKAIKKSFPPEEKNSLIKSNNINNKVNINPKGVSDIKNNNIILSNNINNEINNNI